MRIPVPHHDWVILEEIEAKGRRIVLPDGSARELVMPKRVVDVGPGTLLEGGASTPMQCKPGMLVFSAGDTTPNARIVDGKKYWIIRDSQVYCHLDGEEEVDALANQGEGKRPEELPS